MSSLRRKYNYVMKHIWNPKVYNYSYNFNKALNNTTKLGLKPIENFEIKNYEFESKEKQKIKSGIRHQIYTVEKLKIEDLALKCGLNSLQLQSFLKKRFEIKSILTTGNVYMNKIQFHHEKFSFLKERLKNPNFDKPIKFHSWLTLENLDVIDITLGPNCWILFKNLKREDYEEIYWVETKNIDKTKVVYEPKIIGAEYFSKIKIPWKLYGYIND